VQFSSAVGYDVAVFHFVGRDEFVCRVLMARVVD